MRRAAAVAILTAALALAALTGKSGGEGTAQAAVKRAATTASRAESSRFTMTWETPDMAEFADLNATVEGLMDYVHHRGRITYWADSEFLYDGDVVYMKWPMPWRKSTPWLRYEDESAEADLLDLEERALRNPMGLLDFLSGASRDTRDLGADLVRGSQTTHYEGHLDLQLVVDQAPANRRAELQAWLDLMAEDEPTKVPFELWVDADGITHRLRIAGPGTPVTIDYFDFGTPVEITPPAAAEVMSFEDFFKEIQAHADNDTCSDSDDDAIQSETEDDAPASHDESGGDVVVCLQAVRTE